MGLHNFALKLVLPSLDLIPELDVEHRKISDAEVVLYLDVFHSGTFNIDLELTLRASVRLWAYKGVCEDLFTEQLEGALVNENVELLTEKFCVGQRQNLSCTLFRVQVLLYSVPLGKHFVVFDLFELLAHLGEGLKQKAKCAHSFDDCCGRLLSQHAVLLNLSEIDLL